MYIKRINFLRLFFALLLSWSVAAKLEGGEVTNSTSGNTYTDLQLAIDEATTEDVLYLTGTFSPASGKSFVISGKTLFLIGTGTIVDNIPNPPGTIIRGNNNRVFFIGKTNTAKTYGVYFENLTITNGRSRVIQGASSFGAGIFALNYNLYITNTVIKNNTTTGGSGGGIYLGGCLLQIDRPILTNFKHIQSIISGNFAYGLSGGGLSASSSTVEINKCAIINNKAVGAGGGGILSNKSSIKITNSKISNNVSSDTRGRIGGGIYNSTDSNMTLTNCEIKGNESDKGGGICNNSTLTIQVDPSNLDPDIDPIISGNKAIIYGGGLYVGSGSGKTTINETDITLNDARNGGGIYINTDKDKLSVDPNKVSGNTPNDIYPSYP